MREAEQHKRDDADHAYRPVNTQLKAPVRPFYPPTDLCWIAPAEPAHKRAAGAFASQAADLKKVSLMHSLRRRVPTSNSRMAAHLAGCPAIGALEDAGEMGGVLEADLKGDIDQRRIGLGDQHLGTLHAQLGVDAGG